MKKISTFVDVMVIVLVCLLTLIPLFRQGLFDVHDPTSLVRFATLRQTLADGQIPAAWNNHLNNGFGYPLFLYYAPVFTYLGSFISYVTPYLSALKVTLVLIVGFAAAGMYVLIKKEGRAAAIVSASAYTLLPYHASSIYVRGSYSEAVTWALLPWVLYIWRRPLVKRQQMVWPAILTAVFFMSHNVLPFFFIPVLVVWIYLYNRSNLVRVLGSVVLTIGLSAWFLVPVLFERSFVQAEDIATKTRIADHFVTLDQLWHSPWGYGGSAASGETDGMSFMLGKFQLVLAAMGCGAMLYRRRVSRDGVIYLLIGIVYALGTSTLTAPIWQAIPQAAIIQFPWRLIAIASFGLAAITGYSTHLVHNRWMRYGVTGAAISLLVFFNLKFFQPQRYIEYTDASFVNDSAIATIVKDKIPEYLPTSMPTFPTTSSQDGLERTATTVLGTIRNDTVSPLTIETAYMPHWVLTVDGQRMTIEPNAKGYVTTTQSIEPGDHQVALNWQRTGIEKVAIGVTVVTILIMIGLAI